IKELLTQNIATIHPLPLRTFVTRRFNVKAASAEQAVQDEFHDWRNHLLREISGLIDAMMAASFENARRLFPQFAGPSFPMFWLGIE
ncbi:MAG TPA: hypothetical protein VLE23_05810, partial [Geminicoccaceae bacterium]|nr:hypothetical protein [Geminicoccaceae bacterium]